jgi:hydroxyethylthiazole kinase-like uncharacterized protein yjeF
MSLQETMLLTPAEMYEADRLAMAGGISGVDLMRRAGEAVADCVRREHPYCRRVLVLCGPGNNGGDGFVAASSLRASGHEVVVGLWGAPDRLSGDAADAASKWLGPVCELSGPEAVDPGALLFAADIVIDALLGAGLARPVDGVLAALIDQVNNSGLPVVSVDVPSGIDGQSGRICGTAVRARDTVTFFRLKPGHLLHPGRQYCGRVHLADIGIPEAVLERIRPLTFANDPDLWRARVPPLAPDGHKYRRGHAVVCAGDRWHTGAARLAARAALRAGAGLVTVAAERAALDVIAHHLTAVMLAPADDAAEVAEILADCRHNAVLIGPAAGLGPQTREKVAQCLASGAATVLDADALTTFASHPEALFDAIGRQPDRPVVMTPHDGEFSRLFNDIDRNSVAKHEATRRASARSGAVVILKGADTVIASPDGRAAINHNAPPTLATAGSGDVLAGIVLAFLAQGVPAFEAACMAVWLHGEAARQGGRGLIAEDIPELIPRAFSESPAIFPVL